MGHVTARLRCCGGCCRWTESSATAGTARWTYRRRFPSTCSVRRRRRVLHRASNRKCLWKQTETRQEITEGEKQKVNRTNKRDGEDRRRAGAKQQQQLRPLPRDAGKGTPQSAWVHAFVASMASSTTRMMIRIHKAAQRCDCGLTLLETVHLRTNLFHSSHDRVAGLSKVFLLDWEGNRAAMRCDLMRRNAGIRANAETDKDGTEAATTR